MKKIFKIVLPFLLLAIILSPFSALASTSPYYTNISGSKIHIPVKTQVIPMGASAQCRDSSYSFSAHRSGTCSHHGGVRSWYK